MWSDRYFIDGLFLFRTSYRWGDRYFIDELLSFSRSQALPGNAYLEALPRVRMHGFSQRAIAILLMDYFFSDKPPLARSLFYRLIIFFQDKSPKGRSLFYR